MNILIATSGAHVKYFLVMLESLYLNTEETVDVYAIFSNKENIDWRPLQTQASRYGNRIFPTPVDEGKFAGFPTVSGKWPRILYFKLLAAQLLPGTEDRVLLLESDMIITKTLASLYHMDFNGNHIIGCENREELWGEFGRDQNRRRRNLGIPPEYKLYGGGVLVLNLRKFREDNISFETLKELARKYRYSWSPPEEGLFWALFYSSRKPADPFNYYLMPLYWKSVKGDISDRESEYGSIIHYALCNKPWDSYVLDTECELDAIWWSYACRTPFYDEMRERFESRLLRREDCVELKRMLSYGDVYHQKLIKWKFLQDFCGQHSLSRYLKERSCCTIAVYGINMLQVLLCNELAAGNLVTVAYLVDSFEGRPKGDLQIRLAAQCDFKDVDAVVVAAFLHLDAIKETLKDIPCPVLSLGDIVEDLTPDSYDQFVI